MRFLSLWQPWASLMAIGAKRIETRSWATDYRGLVGIAATKAFPMRARVLCWQPPFAQAMIRAGIHHPDSLPRGAVLAVGELMDCLLIQGPPIGDEGHFGNYQLGRYAWRFRNLRALSVPLPCSGRQRLWVDPDLEAKVTAALS
jgi:hypothetical protein